MNPTIPQKRQGKKKIATADRTEGQMLLVIARWVLVVAGFALVLWDPGAIADMRFKILFLFLLAGANFFLGTQVLRKKMTNDLVIFGASLADIAVITLIILSEGGFRSPTYIFFFPAVLALSVVMPLVETILFTGGILTIYGLISLFSMPFSQGDFQVLLIRLLMIASIAVIGSIYNQMETRRRDAESTEKEVVRDIYFGQIAIIWARWFLITAAAILILWTADSTAELTFGVILVAALMSMNFFVHGRYLTDKPANQTLILLTTLVDLLLVTLAIAFIGPAGLENHYFVFYFPLFFSFALVFTPRTTVTYTLVALVSFLLASYVSDPAFITSNAEIKQFVMRVITLSAMSGLGTYYYRIQRQRRRALHGKSQVRSTPPVSPGVGEVTV